MRFQRLAIATAASVLLGVAIPVANAGESTVKIKDLFFTPVFKVIVVGDAVTWLNEGELRHTVTAYGPYDDLDSSRDYFDSSPNFGPPTCQDDTPSPLETEDDGCIEPGGSFTFTFTKSGTYNYYCKPHVIQDDNGNPTSEPDPNISAQEQPCGMCGQIVVKKVATPTKSARSTKKPSSSSGGTGTDATPTKTASPSRTASPSASPSAGATIDASGNPVAQQKPNDGGGSGGGLVLALLAILALSGAGYTTWRRFLTTR